MKVHKEFKLGRDENYISESKISSIKLIPFLTRFFIERFRDGASTFRNHVHPVACTKLYESDANCGGPVLNITGTVPCLFGLWFNRHSVMYTR